MSQFTGQRSSVVAGDLTQAPCTLPGTCSSTIFLNGLESAVFFLDFIFIFLSFPPVSAVTRQEKQHVWYMEHLSSLYNVAHPVANRKLDQQVGIISCYDPPPHHPNHQLLHVLLTRTLTSARAPRPPAVSAHMCGNMFRSTSQHILWGIIMSLLLTTAENSNVHFLSCFAAFPLPPFLPVLSVPLPSFSLL